MKNIKEEILKKAGIILDKQLEIKLFQVELINLIKEFRETNPTLEEVKALINELDYIGYEGIEIFYLYRYTRELNDKL